MKIFRIFLLIQISIVMLSCSGTSEEQLIGDWDRRTTFDRGGICHAATFVIDNIGYVVSGFNGNNPPRPFFYAFDHTLGGGQPSMGEWIRLDPLRNEIVRQQAVGFSLKAGDGKDYGFVGTGWVFRNNEYETTLDFWRYDRTKEGTDEAWEPVAPLPEELGALPRRGAFAFALEVDGKMRGYVGGGYTDRPDNEYLRDLWVYDPDADSWSREPASIDKRAGAVAFVLNNKAYICNGENPSLINDFWVFDPSQPEGSRWEQKRTMNKVHPDDTYDEEYRTLGRSFGVAFVVQTGGILRGHLVGGRQSSASSCWEYDEDVDLWTQRTAFFNHMNRQNREGMIAFSFPLTGRAFVGMGRAGVSAYLDDMWEFTPLEDDNIYRDMR